MRKQEGWFSALQVGIEPRGHLVKHVENGFPGAVAVTLVWKHHQTRRRAVPFERVVESFALHGKCAGVVVGFPVHKKQRRLDLVGVHKR